MKIAFKIFTLLFLMITVSCKKDFKESQEKMILLTKPEGWVRLKVELKLPTDEWVNITGVPTAIEKDNLLVFDPWYNWVLNEGKLKLEESPYIIDLGKWSFVEKGIQLEEGDLMEVNELSETSLIVTINSTIQTRRYTYGHP
jgi:hypothetical protein